jgi:hypothetical protein
MHQAELLLYFWRLGRLLLGVTMAILALFNIFGRHYLVDDLLLGLVAMRILVLLYLGDLE